MADANDYTATIAFPDPSNPISTKFMSVDCRTIEHDEGFLVAVGAEGPVAIFAPGAWFFVSAAKKDRP